MARGIIKELRSIIIGRDAAKPSSSLSDHPANVARAPKYAERSPKVGYRNVQNAGIQARDHLQPATMLSRSATRVGVNERSPQQETYEERSAEPEARRIVDGVLERSVIAARTDSKTSQ